MTQICSLHDVSVIVVGVNASRFVQECFASLEVAEWQGVTWETIYVDNGSTDDTLPSLAMRFPGVRVLANDTNLGFCKAANQGAAIAHGRHLFFLNDDTLVCGDAIAALVRYADAHPECGALGARLLNTDGTEQYSGRRFPSPLNAIFGRRSALTRIFPNAPAARDYCYKRELALGEAFSADWVSAAAVLLPASVFRGIGGFAENYYYWHEVIFADRVRATGLDVRLLPAARIVHHEGKGSGARPFHVQRRHIRDFHQGAYRCYCEHYRVPRWSPMRAAVAGTLLTRSLFLFANALFRALTPYVRPLLAKAA